MNFKVFLKFLIRGSRISKVKSALYFYAFPVCPFLEGQLSKKTAEEFCRAGFLQAETSLDAPPANPCQPEKSRGLLPPAFRN